MREFRSPNFDERPKGEPVDMLVLHYTGMESARAAIRRLRDPSARVSAHYLIDEDGSVLALVPEEKRAWHAGVSFWRGNTNINGRSIGVELVNPGHEFGYRAFPDAQMDALIKLARDLLDRHPIPRRNVVGHSDVAPRRKTDPGELFDWRTLARAEIGLWPETVEPCRADGEAVAAMLAEFGYEIVEVSQTLAAFQRRFRPGCIGGEPDPETVGLLRALLERVRADAAILDRPVI